jgi:monofunctional biosynthetic peptidoglycan transglycosylase
MNLKLLVLQGLISVAISPEVPETIRALRTRDPGRTALMMRRIQEGRIRPEQVVYKPVALERISPILREAVVLTEDAAFYQHPGFDLRAMQEAAWVNLGHMKFVRGGSTITQQLCKNLFLSNRRTLGRKLKELLLAAYMEQVLSKKRILELYLNVIEWGPGIFGAEAAAEHHFRKSALELTPEEAALLTAAIPFPLKARPSAPSPYHQARTEQVLGLLEQYGVIESDGVP